MLRGSLAPLVALLSFAAAMMASFLVIHLDDNDGATYLVIARHLLEDGSPFELRFLSTMYPHFYEHPPFYIWVLAAAQAAFPASNLGILGLLCGLGTVAAAFVAGRELLGQRAAFFGCTVLCLTEAFFHWTPTTRLDPPLMLAFTASVALLVTARGRLSSLLAGGLVAGLGTLVKGPPALGAPMAAALMLTVVGRRSELRLRHVLVVATSALVLPAAFIAWDHFALEGIWRRHYVHGQLFGSLLGSRSDGRGHLYLLRTVAGRFWPGLALAVLALTRPRRERIAVLLWAVLVLGAFSAASRAFWWYALPAYVPLSLLAGAGFEDLTRRWDHAELWVRRGLLGAAAILVLAMPFGLASHVAGACRFGTLAAQAAQRAGGMPLGLVSSPLDWPGQAILAEHTGVDVVVYAALAEVPPQVQVVLAESVDPAGDGWSVLARHGEMTLLGRSP